MKGYSILIHIEISRVTDRLNSDRVIEIKSIIHASSKIRESSSRKKFSDRSCVPVSPKYQTILTPSVYIHIYIEREMYRCKDKNSPWLYFSSLCVPASDLTPISLHCDAYVLTISRTKRDGRLLISFPDFYAINVQRGAIKFALFLYKEPPRNYGF